MKFSVLLLHLTLKQKKEINEHEIRNKVNRKLIKTITYQSLIDNQ